jgi:pimeloyl-ACP methyl ester carboxylesterase
MASFILIPGAMHGAWTWDRMVPLLERAGHQALAPELPGMGADRSMAVEDITLGHWVDFLEEVAGAAAGPVILVGHSRGGLVIGEAAERLGERVQGLVYLTAVILTPGQSVLELVENVIGRPEPASGQSPLEMATARFYHRCAPEDAAWAAAQLCAEPMQLLAAPAGTSWEGWGRMPRAYIECTDDRQISLHQQRLMQDAAPCDPVIRIDSDHSPFLSAPEALAAALCQVAEAFAARG